MQKITKPQEGEYAPYTIMYIGLLPDDGLVLNHLKDNVEVVKNFVRSLPKEKLTTACAAGEWTVQEILVHIIDTERVFAYRATRIARNDSLELPGFDQDAYAVNSGANGRSLDDILEEYASVRSASLTLFKSFDEAALARAGVANKNPLTVRAAVYITAGHELHHLNSIKENYG